MITVPLKGIIIEDGIIEWYNGPEWDDVAAEEFKTAEVQLEMEMKANAPWADRTGQARSKLSANTTQADGVVTLTLSHGVSYGFWLEVIQNGRFAILGPTIERHGRRITYNAWRRIRYARKGKS
jgi:hypothetical protein